MRPYADRGSSVSLSIVFGVDGQNYEKEMVMSAMLQKKTNAAIFLSISTYGMAALKFKQPVCWT